MGVCVCLSQILHVQPSHKLISAFSKPFDDQNIQCVTNCGFCVSCYTRSTVLNYLAACLAWHYLSLNGGRYTCDRFIYKMSCVGLLKPRPPAY